MSNSKSFDDKWQPIETADKDDGLLLLWDGETSHFGQWSRVCWLTENGCCIEPTHWMPLPEGPKP